MGCANDDIKEATKCLQEKSVSSLMAHIQMFNFQNFGDGICNTFGEPNIMPLVWLPYDDHDSVKDPFFALHPRKIFETGQFNKVPTMIGFTKDEGIYAGGVQDIKKFWYVYSLYLFI